MNEYVLNAVVDSDYCNKLEVIAYSSNPRFYVTVGDMVRHYIRQQFQEKGVGELEVTGA